MTDPERMQLRDAASYDEIARWLKRHNRFDSGGWSGGCWFVRIVDHSHPEGRFVAFEDDWIVRKGTEFDIQEAVEGGHTA